MSINLPFPTIVIQKNTQGEPGLMVNWMTGVDELSNFVMETISKGPYPETHIKASWNPELVILKASEHQYN